MSYFRLRRSNSSGLNCLPLLSSLRKDHSSTPAPASPVTWMIGIFISLAVLRRVWIWGKAFQPARPQFPGHALIASRIGSGLSPKTQRYRSMRRSAGLWPNRLTNLEEGKSIPASLSSSIETGFSAPFLGLYVLSTGRADLYRDNR